MQEQLRSSSPATSNSVAELVLDPGAEQGTPAREVFQEGTVAGGPQNSASDLGLLQFIAENGRVVQPVVTDPALGQLAGVALSGRISLEKLLKEFESLIEQFVDLIEMIIEAIIQAVVQLIDSLFLQLTRLSEVIAQHLEMAPEETIQMFMDRLRPLAKLATEKKAKGFPHSAVDPFELFSEARQRVEARIQAWVETTEGLMGGLPLKDPLTFSS